MEKIVSTNERAGIVETEENTNKSMTLAEKANEINLELVSALLSTIQLPGLDNKTVTTFEKDPAEKSFIALPTFNGAGPTAREAALFADEAKIKFENTTHWRDTSVEVVLPALDNPNSSYTIRIIVL